jgi:hypothetical protein
MEATIRAILARFQGDRRQAIDYCSDIAHRYEHLSAEYWGILDTLRGRGNS